jgi:CRP-like cAMP-binding protein
MELKNLTTLYLMNPLHQIKAYYLSLNPDIRDSDWEVFEQFLQVQVLEKGETITRPGQTAQDVCFVAEGMVMMYILSEDRQLVLEFFNENWYCCDYESFLTRKPSPYYLEAMERTVLVNLSYADLQKVYKLGPSFEKMGRLMAEFLYICLSHKSTALLSQTPEQRYTELTQTRPEIFQRVPQYMIASYLGITPESLSRIRKRMVAKVRN